MPFYSMVQSFLSAYKIIAGIISILLIATEAVLLNFILQEFHLLKSQTSLPTLIYTVLMCSFPENLFLHPVLLGNLFLIFSLKRCLDLSTNKNAISAAFDSGFLISIASFFYFPCILFLFFVWVSQLAFRSFSFREFILAFAGVCIPYLFAGVYFYWFDELSFFWSEKILSSVSNSVTNTTHNLKSFYVLLIFLGIMFVISVPAFFREMGKNKASIRSSFRLFLWFFVLAFLSFLIALPNSFFHFSLAAIPLSILFSNLFLNSKNVFSEIIFSFLIFFIIIYQMNYF